MKITFVGALILLCFVVSIVFCIIAWIMTIKKNKMANWASVCSLSFVAITLLMEIFEPGDHLITDADLYGGSIRLFNNISEKNGLTFSHIDCSRVDVREYINENTKAIFIETPTNPMMNVVDIRKIAKIAKENDFADFGLKD